MTYDMEEFLESCITRYIELAGPGTVVRPCPTPFLAEDQRESPAGAPGVGPLQECPWCCHTCAPRVFKNEGELLAAKSNKPKKPWKTPTATDNEVGQPTGQRPDHHEDRGRLQSIASKVLMKILWAARLARFDLLRAVSHLATKVTKWTS